MTAATLISSSSSPRPPSRMASPLSPPSGTARPFPAPWLTTPPATCMSPGVVRTAPASTARSPSAPLRTTLTATSWEPTAPRSTPPAIRSWPQSRRSATSPTSPSPSPMTTAPATNCKSSPRPPSRTAAPPLPPCGTASRSAARWPTTTTATCMSPGVVRTAPASTAPFPARLRAYHLDGNVTGADGTTIHAAGDQAVAPVAQVSDFTNVAFALTDDNSAAHQLQIQSQAAQPDGSAYLHRLVGRPAGQRHARLRRRRQRPRYVECRRRLGLRRHDHRHCRRLTTWTAASWRPTAAPYTPPATRAP